jgi:hypothetical protein
VAETLELSLEDVIAAGRVLFGPGFVPDGAGWRDALRTTYRRRALETHPDRARAVGRSEADLAREFRKVADAYQVLSGLRAGPLPSPAGPAPRPAPPAAREPRRSSPAAARPPRPRPSEAPPPPSPRGAERAPRAQVHAEVGLPPRRLRFAEYLYYSGRVPWTALVDAIAWQRRQRPAVGRIAVEWGYLTPGDVAEILERRRVADAQRIPFGEFAVRLGYLTSFQLLAVLGRQLRLQRRIGAYFVERGLVDEDEIDAIRLRIARHNANFR